MYRRHEERFELVRRYPIPGEPAGPCTSLLADASGRLWATWGHNRSLLQVTAEDLVPAPVVAPDGQPEPWLGDLVALPDGRVAVTGRRAIYAHDGNTWRVETAFPSPLPDSFRPRKTCRDPHGNFWIGTFDDGLFVHLHDGRFLRVPLPHQARESIIRDLYIDDEGSLWIAARRGLYQIRSVDFRVPVAVTSLTDHRTLAMTQDGAGGVWFLTTRGRTFHMPDQARELVARSLPIAPRYVAAGVRGSVWLAGGAQVYEWRADGGNRLSEICAPDGSSLPIRHLVTSPAGEPWVATKGGTYRWDGTRFICDDAHPVVALDVDHQGRIHAARSDGGFACREAGGWREIVSADERSSRRTTMFCVDDEGALWVAGESPVLACWRAEKWYEFDPAERAVPRKVLAITDDAYGGLWLTTPNRGAVRLKMDDLVARAGGGTKEISHTWFDHDDGLPSAGCSHRTGIHCSSDGELWIGTGHGAAVMDVRRWAEARVRPAPPRVSIESVWIDGEAVDPAGPRRSDQAGSAAIVVAPDQSHVEIRHSAIHLDSPNKNQYRYRLEGWDDTWIYAGSRRTAHYTHLPPGSYRFQVSASLENSDWNLVPANVDLVVQSVWWRTRAAQAGAMLIVLGLGPLVYGLRVHGLKRRQAQQETFSHRLMGWQETERKRVAAELHDGLVQNLLIIKNRLYLLAQSDHVHTPSPQAFADLDEVVSISLEEVRTISQDLRPYQVDRLGLTKAVEVMISRLAEATGLDLKGDITDIDHAFLPRNHIHVYRIIQEGLNNVIRHADAATVRVRVEGNAREVVIRLEDDGRGFHWSPDGPGPDGPMGLGLSGMAERAGILKGRMDCDTAPGKGTRLTFTLPCSADDEEDH